MQKYIARRFQHARSGLTLDTAALSRYDDVIDLSIGDTDLITDQRVIDAAFVDASAGYTHYGDPKGDPELIEEIIRSWKEDFDEELSTPEVLVTTSSCMGMTQVMLGLLNPGDEVLVFSPYFGVYRQQIELAGGICVDVPTLEEDGFQPREDLLTPYLTSRTRAMIVNTPCNPTGAVFDRQTLEMLGRIAIEHDLLLIADEIYTRYVYDGTFIPLRTLPGLRERTITLNSFSKNFMMTGWRVGCIIAHPDLIRVFQHVNNGMTYTAPSISQRAALHALKLRDEIEKNNISIYRSRVLQTAEQLSAIPWITLCRPRGTFYLFPGTLKTGLAEETVCSILFEQAHLLISPGRAFGLAGKNHFRIAATVPQDKLDEAVSRLARIHFPGSI